MGLVKLSQNRREHTSEEVDADAGHKSVW